MTTSGALTTPATGTPAALACGRKSTELLRFSGKNLRKSK
jgi:hypothetical protein